MAAHLQLSDHATQSFASEESIRCAKQVSRIRLQIAVIQPDVFALHMGYQAVAIKPHGEYNRDSLFGAPASDKNWCLRALSTKNNCCPNIAAIQIDGMGLCLLDRDETPAGLAMSQARLHNPVDCHSRGGRACVREPLHRLSLPTPACACNTEAPRSAQDI
jgi:hypothetical protein